MTLPPRPYSLWYAIARLRRSRACFQIGLPVMAQTIRAPLFKSVGISFPYLDFADALFENLEVCEEVQERDSAVAGGRSCYGGPYIRTDRTSYSRVPREASSTLAEAPASTSPFGVSRVNDRRGLTNRSSCKTPATTISHGTSRYVALFSRFTAGKNRIGFEPVAEHHAITFTVFRFCAK